MFFLMTHLHSSRYSSPTEPPRASIGMALAPAAPAKQRIHALVMQTKINTLTHVTRAH